MAFHSGNKKNGKHYWLTPPDLMRSLQLEFAFDFDPCPYPLPDGFDGLQKEWGKSNYVNPPFQPVMSRGKPKGITAWAKKCVHEYKNGNKVVLVFPLDKWVLMLLEHVTEVRNLRDVKWCATEDGTAGPGIGQHIAMFVFDPEKGNGKYINPGSMAAPAVPQQKLF